MSRTYKDKPYKLRKHHYPTNHKHLSKSLCIGPGGFNCPCCFPGPKGRDVYFRSAKRKDKLLAFKDVQQ